ncbi:MAG TPA: flavodoxin domain-containing protein, partial [Chryseosolibacter sp.]
DGEGDPPVQAEEFLNFLHSGKALPLSHIRYGVLALGDTSYTQFCKTGKDFDAALEKLGASRISNRIDCDVDFEDDYERWIKEILLGLTPLSVGSNGVLVNHAESEELKSINEVVYNRKHPFPATVLKQINLNGRHSSKETIHLELDLKGSQLRYQPGDALGIYALNSKKIIEEVLGLLRFSGEEIVETYQGNKNLLEALRSDYELTPLTNVSLTRYAELTGSSRLKKIGANNALLTEYLYGRDIYDLLKEEPFGLSPDTFISILRKNTPRMYSIASSQDNVADEVHLTVSVVRYAALGRRKEGHCSSFLLDRIGVDDQVKVFIDHNSRFKLPTDADRPIIMVGPGTGVAPFRAFLQQREVQENAGKSWLFFGERNFTTDFLYQTEWLQYLKEGILTRADVAFSRDQQRKIYVQHKMEERGKELFKWLEDGAHFYVCGDKQHMAKDVDQTLKRIIQTHGGMTEERASQYVKALQVSDRYQTDVY